MFAKQVNVKRTTLQVEDRRAVLLVAQVRKPKEVAEVSHEQFIRNALKDRLGWPRREPAPQAVLDAARAMAATLRQRDIEAAKKKAECITEQDLAAAVAQDLDGYEAAHN